MLSFYLSMLDTDEQKIEFEKLYVLYKQNMYNAAYKILGNEFDAEDAVHNAFVRIAKNFKRIQRISEEKLPYILIIAKNAAIDIYNLNKEYTEETVNIDQIINTDDEKIFENFELKEITEAISNLPQIYKDILYLNIFYGLTVKECSAALEISLQSAYKRVERAKAELAKKLGIDSNNSKREKDLNGNKQIETGVGTVVD